MNPRLVLLFARDRAYDQLVSQALLGTGAVVLIARSVRDALQIVCRRGRELDLAVLNFDGGCRGMTILSVVHTCHQELPIVVTISEDAEHATAIAYANGARACLNKPLNAAKIADAIAKLNGPQRQLIAA